MLTPVRRSLRHFNAKDYIVSENQKDIEGENGDEDDDENSSNASEELSENERLEVLLRSNGYAFVPNKVKDKADLF